MMEGIGLGEDLTRAKSGKTIRAGKGTMRGRKTRTPKSILLVVSNRDGLHKAASNVPGVDVVVAKDLCAEDLAPGGDPGRLTVISYGKERPAAEGSTSESWAENRRAVLVVSGN